MLEYGALSPAAVLRSPVTLEFNDQTPTAETPVDADVSKLYDPASLVELRKFEDLPEAVEVLANGGYMTALLDGTPTKFLVGGVSGSSAIVAYEHFGIILYFHAQAFVRGQARWIKGRQWDIGSEITNLRELLSIKGPSP